MCLYLTGLCLILKPFGQLGIVDNELSNEIQLRLLDLEHLLINIHEPMNVWPFITSAFKFV